MSILSTRVDSPLSSSEHNIWGDDTATRNYFNPFHHELGCDADAEAYYESHSEGYYDDCDDKYDSYAEGSDDYDYAVYAEESDGYAWNLGYDSEDVVGSDSDEAEYSEPCYEVEPYRSEKFWFEDGTVVIQVNLTLYKLYKGILMKQSKYLESKISEHLKITALLGEPDFESDPLLLNDLSNYEIELLFSYMFPEDYSTQNDITVSEWAVIADVSSKLEIKSVRAAAIAKIIDPVDLINLGESHQLYDCVCEGLCQLWAREDSLSLQEGERLGLDTVIAIAHGRDLLSRGTKWSEVEEMVLMDYYHVSQILRRR